MSAQFIEISVVLARRDQAHSVTLRLAPGATLGEAVESSGLLEQLAAEEQSGRFAVFGKLRPRSHVLVAGDRVEILRALQVSPDEARRLRARSKPRHGNP